MVWEGYLAINHDMGGPYGKYGFKMLLGRGTLEVGDQVYNLSPALIHVNLRPNGKHRLRLEIPEGEDLRVFLWKEPNRQDFHPVPQEFLQKA